MMVKKVSKINANFAQLDKIFKLWGIGQFVVSNIYFYIEKKRTSRKTFIFNIMTLDYDCREGFLRT